MTLLNLQVQFFEPTINISIAGENERKKWTKVDKCKKREWDEMGQRTRKT